MRSLCRPLGCVCGRSATCWCFWHCDLPSQCAIPALRQSEREREFYSQLHCRHTRRAISTSKLVPILSNTYNEQYTKQNIHRQRWNRQYGKNKQIKIKQIVCIYNNETSKDYKQYTILSMTILLPIILIKMNENAFSTIYHIIQHWHYKVCRNCFSLVLKTLVDDTDLSSSGKEHHNWHPLNFIERCPKEIVNSWKCGLFLERVL